MSRSQNISFQDSNVLVTSAKAAFGSSESLSSTVCRSPRSRRYTREVLHTSNSCNLVIPRIKIYASNKSLNFEESGKNPALVVEAASYRCLTMLVKEDTSESSSEVLEKEGLGEKRRRADKEDISKDSNAIIDDKYRPGLIELFSLIFVQVHVFLSSLFRRNHHSIKISGQNSSPSNKIGKEKSLRTDVDSWGHFADFRDESPRHHRRTSSRLCQSLAKVTESVPE